VIEAFFNCAIVYNTSGDHGNALKCYKKCLDLCEPSSKNFSSICCRIGNTYHSLKKFDKAVKYHTKDLQTCEELGDLSGILRQF